MTLNTLVVYCHPNPQSFNHAILETVTKELTGKKHPYRVSDLYDMGWNPILGTEDFAKLMAGQAAPDVLKEQEDVRWAELLIFIFPIWWLERPAMLKGWFERVFSAGFAYRMNMQGLVGLLTDKKALIITTSGGDCQVMGGTLKALKTTVFDGTLGFAGITDIQHMNCFAVPTVSDEERKVYLREIAGLVQKY